MELANRLFQCALWIVIIAMAWRKVEQPIQNTLVKAGLLQKRYTFEDACELTECCPFLHNLLGCEPKKKAAEAPAGAKPKLRISKKLLKKRTLMDPIYDALNSVFYWAQSLVLPEQYRKPCLFGDCGMDQEIKRQKDILLYKDKKESPDKEQTPPPKTPLKRPTPFMPTLEEESTP